MNMVSQMRFSGRDALTAILALFAFIIAIDGYLIFKAVSTFGGIDTPDAYRSGLTYNQRITDEKKQDALGWSTELQLNDGILRFIAADKTGGAIEGLDVEVTLQRPATSVRDTRVKLIAGGAGVYRAAVSELGAGNWIAVVNVRSVDPAITYRQRARLWKQP